VPTIAVRTHIRQLGPNYGPAILSHLIQANQSAIDRDVPKAEVHILDAGNFAWDTAADQITALVEGFVGPSREGYATRRAG
jgi:hypothetical protein